MRPFKTLLGITIGAWALVAALITWFGWLWVRERYQHGGPIPVSQAALLLHPLRQRLHPVRESLERFGVRPGATVLEIGPGPGYFTIEAARMVGEAGRVLALDVQPEMAAVLRRRLDEVGTRNVHILVGDAARLPLRDASADNAFLVTVLGEVHDRPAALAELRRVLRPDGLLAVTETVADPDYLFEAHVRDLCRAFGFEPASHLRRRLGYTMTFRAPGPRR